MITCIHLYQQHVHIPWYTIPLIIFGKELIDQKEEHEPINPVVPIPEPVKPVPQITDIMNDGMIITFE